MCKELDLTRKLNPSWVYLLPSQVACFLLAICLVTSQINPCDATSVSLGSSLTFILLVMGIGILVAIDSVLRPSEQVSSKSIKLLSVACAVFGLWLWLCTTLVPGRGNARFAYNGCWQWIAEGILTLSIVRLSSRYRIAATLIALMLSSAAGSVAYASYQYFISMPALWEPDPLNAPGMFAELPEAAGFVRSITELVNVEFVRALEPDVEATEASAAAGSTGATNESVWITFPSVTFYPDGSSDSTEITLASRSEEDGRRLILRLMGMTGSIRRKIQAAEEPGVEPESQASVSEPLARPVAEHLK